MKAFNVYLKTKLIETVFFVTNMTSDEVKESLIRHDGYDSNIIVREQK